MFSVYNITCPRAFHCSGTRPLNELHICIKSTYITASLYVALLPPFSSSVGHELMNVHSGNGYVMSMFG